MDSPCFGNCDPENMDRFMIYPIIAATAVIPGKMISSTGIIKSLMLDIKESIVKIKSIPCMYVLYIYAV